VENSSITASSHLSRRASSPFSALTTTLVPQPDSVSSTSIQAV
jgi:hypothetical protein